MRKEPLVLKYHPNTIKHLGIALYSTLPPVIAELIANSYDANAHVVTVFLNDQPVKSIIIEDDGDGMSYEDLRIKFLEIGRDRRQHERNSRRPPIGKKGLGKLSVFGIAERISIESIRNAKKNKIRLIYHDIIDNKTGEYKPEIEILDEKCREPNGTRVILENLSRKSLFSHEYIKDLAENLSSRFTVFGNGFNVKIVYNNDLKKKAYVTDKLKFNRLDIEFTWTLPLKYHKSEYEFRDQVRGTIYATEKPTPADMKGIYLTSRGKLVNQRDFFGSKSDDYAYTYLTGWLAVDFIEDFEKDIISTNRESLNWEDEKAKELRKYLSDVLTYIKDEWREKRRNRKAIEIKKKTGVDIDEWLSSLPSGEKKVATKIISTILTSSSIDTDKAANLVDYIKGSFEFESFRFYAAEMSDLDQVTSEQLINLIKDWELVEAREFYNLSKIRIQAILSFEKYLNTNALEVPTLHDFLKHFSWLLDPRIMKFEDEVYYSKLLKKKFVEKNVPVQNRRIDFVCVSFAETFFIIELKRPNTVISRKVVLQADDYVTFVRKHLGNEHSKNVCAYVVGGALSNDPNAVSAADTYRQAGKVYLKPYSELLSNARKYHEEFVSKYEKLKKKK